MSLCVCVCVFVVQGIYRVNGVKTRVEKLCQAFENGKELVELSQASPHDISNVLKLYLRQVCLDTPALKYSHNRQKDSGQACKE